MSKKVCPQCGCTDVSQDWYAHDQGICFVCNTCGFVGDAEEFKEQTVFHRLTASPEVLADKLVYCTEHVFPFVQDVITIWYSTIVSGGFSTKEEAISATAAKLKEVTE